MAQQITYDKAYDTVAPEDFAAMLEVPRYGRRTDAFDAIIAATHDHFWDPLDKSYIDFDQPFDMATTPIMPLDTVVELRSAVADRLDERQKLQLGNDVMHWSISNLLHGEQGALSLSASDSTRSVTKRKSVDGLTFIASGRPRMLVSVP